MLIRQKQVIYFILMFLLVLVFSVSPAFGQKKIPVSFCISPAEKALADSINKIRVQNGMKALQLSISLSLVAKTHVQDLLLHHPDTSICNLSSWSDKGSWTACCYNPYVVNHEAMWKKPKELTNYRYRGYEMVAYMQEKMQVDSLLRYWKETEETKNMILTKGVYAKKIWICMGVGINRNYASVWFGQRRDDAGSAKVCKNEVALKHNAKQKINNTAQAKHIFYLIIGNYPDLKNAREALLGFRKKGFRHAGILRKSGLIRIYLSQYQGYSKALKAKHRLPDRYKNAWILEDK